MSDKCVHVVNIGDFMPEIWQVTYPLICKYVERIDADLNIITQRKYPEWHILYEKVQVHRDGAGYAHNFLLDADVLIHPKFPDFTTVCHQYHVGFNDNFDADQYFDTSINPYFMRDGRNVGIASNAVITCRYTHDLWQPLQYTADEAKRFLLHDRSGVDEFTLSENLARYGLKYNGITWEDWQRYYFVHLGTDRYKDTSAQIRGVLEMWRSDGTEA